MFLIGYSKNSQLLLKKNDTIMSEIKEKKMHNTQEIHPSIHWVGASDRRLDRFENMFPLEDGVSYNSYLIMDEKTCLMDTVDTNVSDVFIDNVLSVLDGRTLDYLVIHHMEPDHCSNIQSIARLFPEVKLVGNKKTFQFMEQFYPMDLTENYVIVKEKEVLELGEHQLQFFMTPMVHWPEVMMSYESKTQTLFTADAFGTFGAHNGNLFADQMNFEHDHLDEIRRYYINIVGRFGNNVQAAFKKFAGLEINMIAPLHGPIYRTKEDIDFIMNKHQIWSTYQPEERGVCMVYSTMYGNTELAMNFLAGELANLGVRNIKMYDVSKTDPSYIVADMHRFSNTVFGLVTYNSELYLKMAALIDEAVMTNFSNRNISYVVNMSWGSRALLSAQEKLSKSKNLVEVGEPLTIKSSLKDDQTQELKDLALAIAESIKAEN